MYKEEKMRRALVYGDKIFQRAWDEFSTYITYHASCDRWYFLTYKGEKLVNKEHITQEVAEFSLT